MLKNIKVSESKKKRFPFHPFILIQTKWLMGRHPSSLKVSWKSVQWFPCNAADKPTAKQVIIRHLSFYLHFVTG